MGHDATKVKLGAVMSSKRTVTSEPASSTTFKAGLAVRRKADGGLELTDDNSTALIGISLGKDCSKTTAAVSVCRKGLGVPLRQRSYAATGTITITNISNAVGDSAVVAGVAFVGQAGAATPGTATFQSATDVTAAAASLAAQINAHATTALLVLATSALGVVTLTALTKGTSGNAITTTWTVVSSSGGTAEQATLGGGSFGPAVHGKIVYINDEGLGCLSTDADATTTMGTYNGGLLTGIEEDGTTATEYAALVDMVGGL